MYKLTDKAKDDLSRDIYKINSSVAIEALASQIMEKIKYARKKSVKKEVKNG